MEDALEEKILRELEVRAAMLMAAAYSGNNSSFGSLPLSTFVMQQLADAFAEELSMFEEDRKWDAPQQQALELAGLMYEIYLSHFTLVAEASKQCTDLSDSPSEVGVAPAQYDGVANPDYFAVAGLPAEVFDNEAWNAFYGDGCDGNAARLSPTYTKRWMVEVTANDGVRRY